MKKRGFGVGKWNGYGGKIEDDESIKAGAARELEEESSLRVKEEDLFQVAIINFYFGDVFVFECHVFVTYIWNGEPIETEEMRPQWFSQSVLPFSEMWVGDKHYLPLILNGKKIKADCYFNSDGNLLKKFLWDETEFV